MKIFSITYISLVILVDFTIIFCAICTRQRKYFQQDIIIRKCFHSFIINFLTDLLKLNLEWYLQISLIFFATIMHKLKQIFLCIKKEKPFTVSLWYSYYTSSIRTSIAASPLRRPILTILVYPPLRSTYFGAISSKSLLERSTTFVFFFLPAAFSGRSVTE